MADLALDSGISRGAWLALLLSVFVCGGRLSFGGQGGPLPPEERVVDLQITGNQSVPRAKILRYIHTRVGRPLKMEVIEEDVRRLNQTGMFVDVRPFSQRVDGGRVVVFQVVERPVLQSVSYVGNKKIKTKVLQKEVNLKTGDSLDPFAVEEARRKIEEFYRGRGFSRVRVTVWEGDKPGDRRVVFLINEGRKQRILWTKFVGNTIADDARLRTQIKSKPGILWFIKGEVDRQQIEEDVKRLKAYYSGLGFARARIGRVLSFSPSGNWLTLTFVIDEGQRFTVREISFIGNQKFSSQELASDLKLKDGQFFNQKQMNSDVAALGEKYGRVGYIFADVQPELRYLENENQFDVVYNISEGDRCRVGRINVAIQGEYPHTKISTVLNRLSFGPGDIVDIRKIRESKRRLIRSELFEMDLRQGGGPQITFSQPKLDEAQTQVARPPVHGPRFRGQSPDRQPRWSPPAARSRPMVVRGQYGPEGGRAVPDLQPRQPWIGGRRVPSPYVGRPPAAGYPAPSGTSAPGTAAGTISAYPPGPANQTGPMPRPGYTVPPPSDPALPYAGGATPPSPLPANEGVFGGGPPFLAGPAFGEPTREIDIFPTMQETQTGRLQFGAGVNSDLGLIGSFIIDEQNFDWTRFPGSWEDVRNATAWRGAGQRFRLELVPGSQYQRYMVSFQEPYLMDTAVSLGLSGFFYDRRYFEWDEQRLGGRISFGYQFTHDLSGGFSFRGEKINVHDPIVPVGSGVPELDEVVGDNALYGFGARLAHDTRDSAFLATEGHLFELSFEQVVGTFSYPRAEADMRRYFLIHQRPDGSGRHVLSLSGRFGWTGRGTPIYDHYYAGGFSTIRGFDFRTVSPRDPLWGVPVGGEMRLLASIQYLFPITADDMLRAVVFCDSGTVQPTLDDWTDKYRIAPGFGLRIMIRAMSQAPIALDFAFPIVTEPSDNEQVFSFFIGFNR